MSKFVATPEMTAALDLFRRKLRIMREQFGLSRPKFAEVIGLPPTTLKNYELGYRTPSLELLVSLNASQFAPYTPWLLNAAAPADAASMVPAAN